MSNSIVDKYQNAYPPHRSIETSPTFIINDGLIYLDNKAPFYHVLLDLSSDFDTLDHNIISIRINDISLHTMVNSQLVYLFYFI